MSPAPATSPDRVGAGIVVGPLAAFAAGALLFSQRDLLEA